jgi:hypothetical protein
VRVRELLGNLSSAALPLRKIELVIKASKLLSAASLEQHHLEPFIDQLPRLIEGELLSTWRRILEKLFEKFSKHYSNDLALDLAAVAVFQVVPHDS